MRKSISIILFFVFAKVAMAQEGEKQPKFRFGLKIAPSVAWLGPDKTKFNDLDVESGGAKIKFGYGLITEFVLAKNYSFLTGVEVNYFGGSINYKDAHSVSYKLNDSTALYLKSREYKQQYITIPLALKLKTNEIGYFTYFGQIGVDASFKIKGRANDEGTLYSPDSLGAFTVQGIEHSESDVDILKQVNLFRIALNVGIGAEWNLAGNTSLLFAVNYNNGFINYFYNKTKDENKLKDNTGEKLEEKANSNYVALTVGVLF
ncbi:MAG: outer membrane beta-barrel protein [Bacteroidia bacterium]